mmetsp:Transcript_3283/g.5980  ORF Transcript_3283/g.5980 Transcript_3283/m.5980 type:complete len:282 (+) Transcript_3283:436-1281(+)
MDRLLQLPVHPLPRPSRPDRLRRLGRHPHAIPSRLLLRPFVRHAKLLSNRRHDVPPPASRAARPLLVVRLPPLLPPLPRPPHQLRLRHPHRSIPPLTLLPPPPLPIRPLPRRRRRHPHHPHLRPIHRPLLHRQRRRHRRPGPLPPPPQPPRRPTRRPRPQTRHDGGHGPHSPLRRPHLPLVRSALPFDGATGIGTGEGIRRSGREGDVGRFGRTDSRVAGTGVGLAAGGGGVGGGDRGSGGRGGGGGVRDAERVFVRERRGGGGVGDLCRVARDCNGEKKR